MQRLAAPALALLIAISLTADIGGSPAPPSGAQLYLALGDSLATGYQPRAHRAEGYADVLWRRQLASTPNLLLQKLGRGGEAAASMVRSSRPGPSQLEQAEALLKSRGAAFVTLDIGANEVERCHRGYGFDGRCVANAIASLRASLPLILRRLKAALHGSAPLLGINYYNAFLGSWVHGRGGRLLELRSVRIERRINATLGGIYRRAHVPVADVEEAFATDRIERFVRLEPYGRVPLAVARVCRWTWSCEADDDHANSAGYAVIARAVAKRRPLAGRRCRPGGRWAASSAAGCQVRRPGRRLSGFELKKS